ncbi:MAG: crossover junction endodeoxyribonuclease RuvC, partial [Acidimicrobiia bacterium]
MFVLGIDPGLTTTGYGFVRRHRDLEAIAAGVIRTDPDSALTTRLLEIHRRLAELIVEHRPDAIALEQVFTNRNLQTAIAVGRAAGVAILAAAQHQLEVFEYPPTVIKSAVTGDGAADKRMVATMVGRRGGGATPSPTTTAADPAIARCPLAPFPVF